MPVDAVSIGPDSRIVVHTSPRSPSADRFRFLRMRLRDLWDAQKLRRLLITSALPRDGKSTVALNLATTLAEHGKRTVLLIEADLHHPTLTVELGLERGPGLAECLENGVDVLSVIRRIEPLGWYLLPAGMPQSNPTELLQNDALSAIIERVGPYFDWVLIDAPPVKPLADALSLSRQAHATLLVARAGRTPSQAVEEALTLIGRKNVLGIILNGVEGIDAAYSKYYGSYARAAMSAGGESAEGKHDR
ncbi:MAG TPA: CpsD/CapB family tyrosine-protein kinase [Bryobacteraceae bacterium]|nr:CpsD/CapB family tyrosine-protein kinase [Bryobacteraceae bacterium]